MNEILEAASVVSKAVIDLNSMVRKNDPIQEKLVWNGVPISIEWLAGQKREYENVPESERKALAAHYGYIRRTDTDDGEELDVYLKPDSDEKTVFLLVQVGIDLGEYDEIKFMLGFDSIEEAKEAYLAGMPTTMFGAIFPVDWDKFNDDILDFYED